MKEILPNYKNGSIVNLMSSIARAYEKKHPYNPLSLLPPKNLKNSRSIVLIIFDGLGFEWLMKNGANTILKENLKGKMTSVFPATTAAAETAFLTGLPPQQHGLTGWNMNLKEIGAVSMILRSLPRFEPLKNGVPFSRWGIKIADIVDVQNFFDNLKTETFNIRPDFHFNPDDFIKAVAGKSKLLSYHALDEFFGQIKKAVKSRGRKKYIYAYWPEPDTIGHKYGINSQKAKKHLKLLDKKLRKFVKEIKGAQTTVIITGDHGMIDVPKNKIIRLEKHPKLKDCLSLPLCGDSRTIYCYVRPSKTKFFENYVKTKLKNCCRLYKSEELIKKNYFGLFKPNKKLAFRVGDYTIIMKNNYKMKDLLIHQKDNKHISNHSGLSSQEMLVPLVIINV